MNPQSSKKVLSAEFSVFMAQCLYPIPDAELSDKELERIERRVKLNRKRDDEAKFHRAWVAYKAAHYRYLAASFDHTTQRSKASREAEIAADIERVRATDKVVRTPVGKVSQLRWKQKELETNKLRAECPLYRKMCGHAYRVDLAVWERAIAADAARLG